MSGRWMDRLGKMLVRRGWNNGFVFRTEKGRQARISDYNDEFVERLGRVRMSKPHFFEPNLMLGDAYNLKRSLRRGSTSEATNNGVPREVIELHNRWRKIEEAKGRRPAMSMASHYTEIKLMLKTLYAYSHLF